MKTLKGKGIYQLLILMILVSMILSIASIIIIYKIVLNEKRTLLKELCESQQDIIQSIYKKTNDVNIVLNVLQNQQKITNGLGSTGEYTIGYQKNDSIYFLLRMRQGGETVNKPISLKSDFAIPLQYALSKNTDFIEGLDYRGKMVLAYCTYIPELKWGLVTKMDISEVRLPFYRAGLVAMVTSLILILIATLLFRRITRPIAKRIKESEENYRRLFEYSAIPIWKEDYSEIKKYFDKLKNSGITNFRSYFEGHKDEVNHLASLINVIEINQKSVEFFKAENKDDVIKNMLFYYNETSLEVFREEMTILAEGGKRFECEMPIRTLSGDIKILDMHLSVVRGHEDTLSNVLVSFTDITERKRHEEFLIENKEQLSVVFNGVSETLLLLDFEGNIIVANKIAEKRFKQSATDIIGKNIYDFIPVHFHETRKKQVQEMIQKKKPVKFLDSLENSFFEVTFYPILDVHGNVTRFISSALDITDRKQFEEELSNSEERFRAVFEQAAVGVALLNTTTGRYMRINQKYCDILGYTMQEMLQKTLMDVTYGPDVQPNIDINVQFMEGTITEYSYEKRYVRKDGEIVWGNLTISPLWTPGEKPQEFVHIAIVEDITERKKKEVELQKLNRTLSALSKSGQEMIRARKESVYLDEVCKIIINDCGYAMVWIGYAEENEEKTVKPMAFSGFEKGYLETLNITWADTERGKGPTGTAIRTGKPAICKNMLTDPAFKPWCEDAIMRGYASSVVLPLIADSKTFGAISIYSKEPDSFTNNEIELLSELANDLAYGIISIRSSIAQKEAEELLINSETRYRRLFESAKDGILILDADTGMIVDVNPYLINKLGYPYEMFLGKKIWDIGFFKDIIANMDNFLKLQQKDYIRYENLPLETADGRKINVEFVSNVYLVNRQKVIQCNIRDITERKRFENELKEKNTELIEINATKDKFFKIIAHDMKNPFISLLGASELLYENAEKYNTEKIIKLSKILNDSAKSGYDMLLNLLEWAKSQAGNMLFQPEKINLKELINKNHQNLIEYASGKKINLNIDIAGDMQIYADKNMLDTILRNLINNALKFTPKGGKVTVSTKDENGSLIIFVKDTGVGVEKSDFNKLFRSDIKFSQPGTEHEGGTGLGLLLCKEFVEKHDGRIWVESEVGKGSTFYFTLKQP